MNFENLENSLQSVPTWVTSGKPSYISEAMSVTTLFNQTPVNKDVFTVLYSGFLPGIVRS